MHRLAESEDRNQNSNENEKTMMKAGKVHRLPPEQTGANAEGENTQDRLNRNQAVEKVLQRKFIEGARL